MHSGKYGFLAGMFPQGITPGGKVSLGGQRALQLVAAAYGSGGGPDISKTIAGEVPLPPEVTLIYGKIFEPEDSSSSDTSSDATAFSATDASFTDPDGYQAYAFEEINRFHPWKGEVLEGGIKSTLPINGEGGGNWAYTLNGNSIAEGVLCALLRAGNHWVIIGVDEGDTSSDGTFTFTIDCDAGTITVGDEEPQTPVDPPADPGTGDDPTTNPKKSGRSGSITTDTGDPGVP